MLELLLIAAAASSSISPLIALSGAAVGLLTIIGFFVAARAYVKAKSIDALDAVNSILRAEVDALDLSRKRMDAELKQAQQTIAEQGAEIARLSVRTDLTAHQQHLDKNHEAMMEVLTRIANESQSRNGALGELMTTVLTEIRRQA